MNKIPRVSVIIPTYNRRDYVQEAIDSVMAQTFTDYEVIVVDDGSTDGTGDALTCRYGNRIRYVWQENQGESAARNNGIALSRGEYIGFLDSDDLWLPGKLEQQTEVLITDGSAGMVFSQAWQIDETGKRTADSLPLGRNIEPDDLTIEGLYTRNSICGPSTVMLRSDLLARTGVFDRSIKYGEDWDLWIRVAAVCRIVLLPIPLASIRRHRDTQCYYPDPARIALRLHDHISLLDKAAKAQPEAISPPQQQCAMAKQYVLASLGESVLGHYEKALSYLEEASRIYPASLCEMDGLAQLVVDHAVIVGEMTRKPSGDVGQEFIDMVCRQLRETGDAQASFENHVRVRANLALGFLLAKRFAVRTAFPYAVRALWYRPRFAWRGGGRSLLSRSIFGSEFVDRVRLLLHRTPAQESSSQ